MNILNVLTSSYVIDYLHLHSLEQTVQTAECGKTVAKKSHSNNVSKYLNKLLHKNIVYSAKSGHNYIDRPKKGMCY